MPLITEEQVVLDLTGADRHEATRRLGERLVASGRCTDLDAFLNDVRKREETMATGLPGGIGIPHARSAAITEPSLVFGRTDGIDWGAKDGPARLIFLIAAPAAGGEAHMQMLPKLAKALMNKDFRGSLENAGSAEEVAGSRDTESSAIYYNGAQYEGIALGLAELLGVDPAKVYNSDFYLGAEVTILLGADYAPPTG